MNYRYNRTHLLILAFSLLAGFVFFLGRQENSAAKVQSPLVTPAWGEDVRANSDVTNTSQHEPHLAISRTDPNVVVAVAKDYRINNNKEVWIYVSQDGGQTWPAELQRQIPGMPEDIPNQSDPIAMARDDGRIYVVALGHGAGWGLFITWTDDNGETWQDPSIQITHNNTPCCLDDKEWLAIDNNPASPYYHNMYIAWANGNILFKRSTDGGLTWSSYINLTPTQYAEYPYPVVAADGSLYVFYMDPWGYCTDGAIYYRKSTDGGVTFSPFQYVVATSQPCSPIHGDGGYDQWRFFSIITAAADPNNPDNLWVAWTDDNNITWGKTDVLYVRTTDGGDSWLPKERLSHDDPGAYVDHITPVFAIGEDSRLHAFWLDRRDDLDNNRLFHGYHTSSIDGGITWEPDSRVSDAPFDLNLFLPPPSGYNAAGDYWGLDVFNNIVMAAWNTTVENSQDIYVDRGFLGEVGILTGVVSDAETSAPIQNAQVEVDSGLSDLTDASGVYTITLPVGVYTATARADDYFSQTVTGVEIITDTITSLDFALQPFTATVSGLVSDAMTATPIQGAQVSASDGTTALTDEFGGYTMVLDAGIYTFTAQSEGYMPLSYSDIEIISGTYTLDFALQPITATLAGQVSDAISLVPIQGAQLSLDSGPDTLTNESGYYTFTLSPGTYTVTAQAEDYLSQSEPIEIISETTILDFALQPIVCLPPHILSLGISISGLSASFSPSITGTLPFSYLWDFGDGSTSTLEAPIHNYSGYGSYSVVLNITNECGSDAWSEQIALLRSAYLPLIFKPAP
jgi:PKD repeat protein